MSGLFTKQNIAGAFAALALSGLIRWMTGKNLGA